MDILKLSTKQQRAFNRLKKAYSDCEKEGIYFYNYYGHLSAVDSKLVRKYDDEKKDGIENSFNPNSFNIASEWTDDQHYFHLTEEGKKIHELDKD